MDEEKGTMGTYTLKDIDVQQTFKIEMCGKHLGPWPQYSQRK